MSFFKIIPQNCTGILTTWGRFSRLLKPGFNPYVPFAQKVQCVLYNGKSEQALEFNVKTEEGVFAQIKVKIHQMVESDNTDKAYYSSEDYKVLIDSYTEDFLRSRVSSMKLNAVYNSQSALCDSIHQALKERMDLHGVSVIQTLITDIRPPPDVEKAMNNVLISAQERDAARNIGEAEKIKATAMGQAEKTRAILQAEADMIRRKLLGQGLALQRKAILEGCSKGLTELCTSFKIKPEDAMKFLLDYQRCDTLERIGTSGHTKSIMIPVDHGNVRNQIIQANEVY